MICVLKTLNWFKLFPPKMLEICCHDMRFERCKCMKMRKGSKVADPAGELTALPQAPQCPDVRCPVYPGRLSKRFLAKSRFIAQLNLASPLIRFLHEVFVCLRMRTAELESLDWWGWCDLGEAAS